MGIAICDAPDATSTMPITQRARKPISQRARQHLSAPLRALKRRSRDSKTDY
jgi:hypothetical protein